MNLTFKLKYIDPTLIAVVCEQTDLEVLTFHEGLYDLTVKFNSELNQDLYNQAILWLQQNHIGLLMCHADPRRHIVWMLDKEIYWTILLTAFRHGLPLDENTFPEGKANMSMVMKHSAEIRESIIKSTDKIDTYRLDMCDDDFVTMMNQVEDYMSDDEIVELIRTFLYSFSTYCITQWPDADKMPDEAFAELVAEPWARDFLWWPSYVNNHPRYIIGNTIEYARNKKGWTQRQLADHAGITEANVRSIEVGKYDVKIDVLFAIAVALGITIEFGVEK